MILLMISGSTRAASSNTTALRTLRALAPDGDAADLYDGLADLPAFNPDHDIDPLPGTVADLRLRIEIADAVVFCAPEYAGTIPGSLKNLLEWTVKGSQLHGKAVAWLNIANEGRGDGAVATLDVVLGYVGAETVADACLRMPTHGMPVSPEGLLTDPQARERLTGVWAGLSRHVGIAGD